MCDEHLSILHYGPLIETNYLYALSPNENAQVACEINPPPTPTYTKYHFSQNTNTYQFAFWENSHTCPVDI